MLRSLLFKDLAAAAAASGGGFPPVSDGREVVDNADLSSFPRGASLLTTCSCLFTVSAATFFVFSESSRMILLVE